MKPLALLDLFSGVGGFSLGLEATGGFRTVAFCEIDEFCWRVLARHWPKVPCYADIRELTADALRRDGIAVDVLCGGFPCQDVSCAGRRAGIEGGRSGLWSHYARLIGELRPRYAIVENVPGLLHRGMGTVLGDLAALGYSAIWDCIPASAIGAPHRRDRVWIVAYAGHAAGSAEPGQQQGQRAEVFGRGGAGDVAYSGGAQRHASERPGQHVQRTAPQTARLGDGGEDAADPERDILRQQSGAVGAHEVAHAGKPGLSPSECAIVCGARRGEQGRAAAERGGGLPESFMGRVVDGLPAGLDGDPWLVEPDIPRVAAHVKDRVQRLRALGNSIVPQIAEIIGRAILAAEAERQEQERQGARP